MKERIKLFGIIAIIAIIGLSMTACGEECEHEWEVTKAAYLGEAGEESCDACGETQEIAALGQSAFYGKWTTAPWTVEIDAGKLEITNTGQTDKFVFTITEWGNIIENGRTSTVGPAATYKKGYKLTGTSTALNSLNIPAQTEIEIFLHVDTDKMWNFYVSSNGGSSRIYTKE